MSERSSPVPRLPHVAAAPTPGLITDQLCRNTETLLPKDGIDTFPLGVRRVPDPDDCPVWLAFARSCDSDLHTRTGFLDPTRQILVRRHGAHN